MRKILLIVFVSLFGTASAQEDIGEQIVTGLLEYALGELVCEVSGKADLRAATAALKEKNYAAAIPPLERLHRSNACPNSSNRINSALGSLYLNLDRYQEAIPFFEKWNPSSYHQHRFPKYKEKMLVIAYIKTGGYAKAIPILERSRPFEDKTNSNSLPNEDLLLLSYSKTGQTTKTISLLEGMTRDHPDRKHYWLSLAGSYFKADDIRGALRAQIGMYDNDLLTSEKELIRLVNLANSLDEVVYARRVLRTELERGRISSSLENLEKLGNLQLYQLPHVESASTWEKIVARRGDAKSKHKLLRAYAEAGRWGDVSKLGDQLHTSGQLDSISAAITGRAKIYNSDLNGAKSLFEQWANTPTGKGWLKYIEEGNFPGGASQKTCSTTQMSNENAAKLEQIYSASSIGDFDESIKLLDELRLQDLNCMEQYNAYLMEGETRIGMGDLESAIESYQAAILTGAGTKEMRLANYRRTFTLMTANKDSEALTYFYVYVGEGGEVDGTTAAFAYRMFLDQEYYQLALKYGELAISKGNTAFSKENMSGLNRLRSAMVN